MWLFTKNSFISVVQHRELPNNLCVRARVKGHLTKLFPKKSGAIQETPEADYRYRIIVSKKEFANVVTEYIMRTLKYDNFKAAQDANDRDWQDFLFHVWKSGVQMQKF